eukprot:4292886-Amphidinium_carterae.1
MSCRIMSNELEAGVRHSAMTRKIIADQLETCQKCFSLQPTSKTFAIVCLRCLDVKALFELQPSECGSHVPNLLSHGM